jgi:serine/threonine-protein kinase HipA
MGTLTVTDSQARFTYHENYAATGLRGLGLVYPPDQFSGTIARDRSPYFDFHPPIQTLVPPRSERNFQRALLQKYLHSINLNPRPGFATDWEMLIRAGHGGVGHLDVFESDEAALQWYATPSKKGLVELDEKFGFSLREFMTWYGDDGDSQALIELLGATPTLGGAIPKLPLSISRQGWDGRIGLPSRFGDVDRSDIILKLENSASYPGIIELEQLALEVHRAAGFEVPRFWAVEVSGLRGLAVERFDRSPQGAPLFMESLYSIMASGSRHISNHYSASYDRIVQVLNSPRIQLVSDRNKARLHLFERLVMALLTGNGDLHLENLSIIERDGELGFSPVYDPTPMRAYRIHDMLTPPGMTFGDYGDYLEHGRTDQPVAFVEAMGRFIKTLGLSRKSALHSLQHLLAATEDYPQRVGDLHTLPGDNRQNLIAIHYKVRQQLEAFVMQQAAGATGA